MESVNQKNDQQTAHFFQYHSNMYETKNEEPIEKTKQRSDCGEKKWKQRTEKMVFPSKKFQNEKFQSENQ